MNIYMYIDVYIHIYLHIYVPSTLLIFPRGSKFKISSINSRNWGRGERPVDASRRDQATAPGQQS